MSAPAAFLLLWNPDKFPWDGGDRQSFAWCVLETWQGRRVPFQWRIGRSRQIAPGDRLYLLMTGRQRGLVGSGRAVSATRQFGRLLVVDLEFDCLLPREGVLAVSSLARSVPRVDWRHQYASGNRIDPAAARQLARCWQDHCRALGHGIDRPLGPHLADSGLPPDAAPPPVPARALSIRQPHAEAILRGVKTEEFRWSSTAVRGPVWIYAPRARYGPARERRLLAEYGGQLADVDLEILPRGVLVGTVEIVDCREHNGAFAWQLAGARRLASPLRPRGRPQPMWFRPF